MLLMRHRIPTPVQWLLLIDLGLVAIYLFNQLIGAPIPALNQFLDLDRERTLPTWFSSAQLLAIACLAGIFARYHIRKQGFRHAWVLLTLPLLFLFFSLDETLEIHEWLGRQADRLLPGGDRTTTLFHTTGIWMFVVGIPFSVLFALWFARFWKLMGKHRPALRRLATGMTIFLGGALGVEIFSNFVSSTHSVGYILEVSVEELLEMVGATWMFWSTLEMVRGLTLVFTARGWHIQPLTVSSLPHETSVPSTRRAA